MRSSIPTMILGDLIIHQKGFAFKSRDYQDDGIPVVRVSNFTQDSISHNDLKFISHKIATENQKVALKEDDVIIATVGSWPNNPASIVGKTVRVPSELAGSLMNQNSVILRVRSNSTIDQKYLFFALKTKRFSDHLVSTAQGSANQASITLGDIFAYDIEWPEKSVREKIVNIIESLSSKLRVNTQLNQTLEQITQTIFKSWFVDFDPIKAKIAALDAGETQEAAELAAMSVISGRGEAQLAQLKMQDADAYQQLVQTAALFPAAMQESELGEIPNGWKVKSFGEVSQCFDSKRIPLSKKQREEKKPGHIPYHGATSVMDYVNEWIFEGIYLLLGEDGSVIKEDGTPFIQYIWGRSWVNNHAHVLQGKNGVSTEQLMLFMQTKNISPYINGAVQLKLNQGNMNSIPFLDAGVEINTNFYKTVSNFYSALRIKIEENRGLAQLRDSLLPKLLSGEINIISDQGNEND